ncbi:hypothetical protein [Modestobacter marinus]|uniref:hypothetical protein n=1 Tax=Modestobacter marinus TaxID=477641 RepID=UPI001C946D3C|nr:hypothetical protein [Modestobacter marinus]
MTQRQSIVTLRPSPQPDRIVEVADADADVVFRDWLGTLDWPLLELLVECTAVQVGAGGDFAHTIYDDDGDAADDPFDGVRITAGFRDDASVVVSRPDYDRIVADVCDIARAHPPEPLPQWWPKFLEKCRSIADRADRA